MLRICYLNISGVTTSSVGRTDSRQLLSQLDFSPCQTFNNTQHKHKGFFPEQNIYPGVQNGIRDGHAQEIQLRGVLPFHSASRMLKNVYLIKIGKNETCLQILERTSFNFRTRQSPDFSQPFICMSIGTCITMKQKSKCYGLCRVPR